MLRLMILLLCCAALIAGCNKGKAKTQDAATADASAQPVPTPTADDIERTEKIVAQQVPEDQRQALQSEITKQAPQHKLSLDTKSHLLLGVSSMPGGMPVAQVVSSIYLRFNKGGKVSDPATAVGTFLGELGKKGQTPEPAIDPQEQQQAEAAQKKVAEEARKNEHVSEYRPAQDPIGDWRSVGEIREGEKNYLVEHNDKYYKIMLLGYKNKLANFQEYRDGEMKSKSEYPFTYNALTGELKLTAPSGGPGDVFLIMEKLGVPDHIFMRPTNQAVYAFTEYKRVGNGGKPRKVGELKASELNGAGGH